MLGLSGTGEIGPAIAQLGGVDNRSRVAVEAVASLLRKSWQVMLPVIVRQWRP